MGGSIKKWGVIASICFVMVLLLLDFSHFSPVQKEVQTASSIESITRDITQTNVVDWKVTKLSPEQFQKRYTELTGERSRKDLNDQDKESQEMNPEEQIPPDISGGYDAEYVASIDLGEGIFVQAGVLVQVQEVRDGEEIRKEFRKGMRIPAICHLMIPSRYNL